MKALQIVAPRRVKMVELPTPQIERGDHILVRIRATTICNMHEWKIYTDQYHAHFKPEYPLKPGHPGHEGCGDVVAVGDNVHTLSVGDMVFLTSHAGCLHAQCVACPADWAFRLEPGTSAEDAAPMELFASALGLLEKGMYVAGRTCLVVGLGPGGLAVVQVLRALQCRRIVVADLNEARLARAIEMGADVAVNASNTGATDELAAYEPETAIDCSGSHEGIRLALRAARKETLLFGYNDEPFEVVQADWFVKRLVIRTGNIVDQDVARRTAVLLKRGLIRPAALISHHLPFSEAGYAQAMELIEKRACDKVIMERPE